MATSWEREIEEDIAKRRIKASKLKFKSEKYQIVKDKRQCAKSLNLDVLKILNHQR